MAMLECRGVSKAFGGVQALAGVNLAVQEGTITGLIGPNGSGKTTLFNAITGFGAADAGEISFEGHRIEALAAWEIAQLGLARTFQTPGGLPSLTVWENLMVAGTEAASESALGVFFGGTLRQDQLAVSRRVEELLTRLDLWELRDTLISDLSVTDTKLVEIARQLMMRPKLMMLDEPASGFTPDQCDRLAEFIRSLGTDGVTLLVIEHNLSFVLSLAEYVYVLTAGKNISEGTPDEVTRDENVIRHYLGSSHESA